MPENVVAPAVPHHPALRDQPRIDPAPVRFDLTHADPFDAKICVKRFSIKRTCNYLRTFTLLLPGQPSLFPLHEWRWFGRF
jgi:hypothetical protein